MVVGSRLFPFLYLFIFFGWVGRVGSYVSGWPIRVCARLHFSRMEFWCWRRSITRIALVKRRVCVFVQWLIFLFSSPRGQEKLVVYLLENRNERKKNKVFVCLYTYIVAVPTPPDSVHLISKADFCNAPMTWPSLLNFFLGRILLGCGGSYVQRQPDVMVQGTGVEPIHCYIENVDNMVTLYPLGEMTSVDGQPVATPTRLTQGKNATQSCLINSSNRSHRSRSFLHISGG